MLTKLYVRNLPAEFDSSDLEDLFTTVGNVLTATIEMDPTTGQSRGHGRVEMSCEREAADCIERFNGYPLQGATLIVHEDKPHVPKKDANVKRKVATRLKRPADARNKELSAQIRAAIVATRK